MLTLSPKAQPHSLERRMIEIIEKIHASSYAVSRAKFFSTLKKNI
jgi:hypothetical protein